MLVFIVFFIIVFILLWAGSRKEYRKLRLNLTAYFVIFLFSALRFDVGYDYIFYYQLLTKQMKFYEDQFNRLEYLNQQLISICQAVDSPQLFFILTSFIITYLTYRTITRHSNNIMLSTLIFLSLPIYFLNSLSIIRQYVAVSIIFYAYTFIKERQLPKFLLAVLLASLFHKSAIFAVILYWLYNLKLTTLHYIILFILGLVSSGLSYHMVEMFAPQYLTYLDRKVGVGGNTILLLFQITGFAMLFMIPKLKDKSSDFFLLTSYYTGLLIWSSLSEYGHAGIRGGLYFMVFFIIFAPEVLSKFTQRTVLKLGAYILALVMFIITLWIGTKNENKDPNLPYRVFFLTDKSEYKGE
ncbi:MAG: EpsG family protein [Lutimonas sp.]